MIEGQRYSKRRQIGETVDSVVSRVCDTSDGYGRKKGMMEEGVDRVGDGGWTVLLLFSEEGGSLEGVNEATVQEGGLRLNKCDNKLRCIRSFLCRSSDHKNERC
jgi:hypothetical protein